jgi:putative solute:sodium symporter small subunit
VNPKQTYWKANLRAVSLLLLVWFLVGYVFSIFGITWLNQFHVGHAGLGFWMAQQGSIYVFVLIIIAYAVWMDRLDRRFKRDEKP